ncbi:hypothetical protein M8J77_018002 [Diaphorina citri]|nr:hypothetical protein M8J77_018002 [Diaphorina citri]
MEKFQIIGDVCKFNPDEEEFSDFNERLEMFFLANGIVDDKQKCAIFISSMSASTFKILKSLISPKKVNKCAFKDVIKCMSEHYCTNRLVITERYKFYKYCQEPGQSIPSYIAKISELASHCRFEDFLDQALRDKFVCGLSNNAIRSKLLDQDDNLSFKEACDIAKCKQVAMSENENILMPSKKSDTYMENVNVVQNRCKHCGYSHSSLCKFRRARCHKCKELGHIAPVCEKKNVKYMQPGSSGSGVEHDSDLNEDSQLLHISQVCTINHVNQQFKEYKVRINVLGKNFPMCVDTGSPVSIISCDALRSLDEKSLLQNIEKSSLSLKSYSGNSLNVIGMVRVPVEYKNVTELKSYLGLLGYYQKFIPNLSFLLQPMYELLKKDKKWNFNSQCSEAFETSKLLLEKYNILVPFNETKPLVLQCDSSDYGIGAVLGHDYGDDVIRPIHFASKTLSSAERNYSQVQKEALAVIYGVQYFSKYLTGRKFTLITDNKALVTLFGEDKAVPMLSSARLQRWSLILSNFDYSIKYKKGTQIPVADALSRLPLSNDKTFDDTVYYLGFKELGLTANTIINSTRKDKVLSKVMEYVKHGWPSVTNLSCDEKTFHTIKDELSIENDLLLRANRIIIPDDLKEQILKLLHDEHPGIVRMKALARSYVWFPGIDKEIENYVKSCSACQAQSNNAQESLLTYWPQTSYPFQRIHIDYAEYDKKNLFIIYDAFSKWIEVEVVSSTDSKSTIQCLERFFSNFGFPETCVSDNGPQLVSKEMVDFMENNSITMVNSPPYHPKSNGAAERAVQVVKRHLEKQEGEKEKYSSFKQRVTSLLHVYRNTPHSVTGKSPAEMIFKFTPKIKLGKLKQVDPVKDKVTKYQEYQKKHVNQNRSINYYQVNEKVWVRSVRGEKVKWFPGHIVKIMSPYTYTVETEHQSRLVHADHLKKFEVRRSTRVSRPPPRFSF